MTGGAVVSRADLETQLRVLEQNMRQQEADLLRMRGGQIALQQLLALLDSRERGESMNITPSRDVSAAGRNFQGGVTYSVDDDTAAAIEAALDESTDPEPTEPAAAEAPVAEPEPTPEAVAEPIDDGSEGVAPTA